METAIQRAAYSKFGSENEIEAQIDRKSGNIKNIKFNYCRES